MKCQIGKHIKCNPIQGGGGSHPWQLKFVQNGSYTKEGSPDVIGNFPSYLSQDGELCYSNTYKRHLLFPNG